MQGWSLEAATPALTSWAYGMSYFDSNCLVHAGTWIRWHIFPLCSCHSAEWLMQLAASLGCSLTPEAVETFGHLAVVRYVMAARMDPHPTCVTVEHALAVVVMRAAGTEDSPILSPTCQATAVLSGLVLSSRGSQMLTCLHKTDMHLCEHEAQGSPCLLLMIRMSCC